MTTEAPSCPLQKAGAQERTLWLLLGSCSVSGRAVGGRVVGGALGLPFRSYHMCASSTIETAIRPRRPPNYTPCHNGQPRNQHLDKEICHMLVRWQAKQI